MLERDLNGVHRAHVLMRDLERQCSAPGTSHLDSWLAPLELIQAREALERRWKPLDNERSTLGGRSPHQHFKVVMDSVSREVSRHPHNHLDVGHARCPCLLQRIQDGTNHALHNGCFMHRFSPSLKKMLQFQ